VIRTASLLELIEELTDYACGSVPEKNCSCHIAPPCNDCVTYAHQRELAVRSKIAQRELRLVLLIDPNNKF
jgi:hypothetical protein